MPRCPWVVAVFALAAGCAGPGNETPGAAKEGLVVYHDAGTRGSRGVTFVFTTDPKLGEAYDSVQVSVGTREGGRRLNANSGRILREQLEHAGSPRPRRVSPEAFGELWAELESAGLFELTEHRGETPPGSTSWFLVESAGERRTFLRPRAGARAQLEHWRDAKLVLIRFQSQGGL